MNKLMTKWNKQKLETEIKLETISYQSTSGSESPFQQLCAQPQTKNGNSSFNYDITDVCVTAHEKLNAEGWRVLYMRSANNGVSCDENFIKQLLLTSWMERLVIVA